MGNTITRTDELIARLRKREWRYFKCSACGDVVQSKHDLSGENHDVPQTAHCSGMTSMYEVPAPTQGDTEEERTNAV